MAIKVSGVARLNVDYTVELDMTEEDFDALSQDEMDLLIEDSINWPSVLSDAEVVDIDVDDLWEVDEEEG